MEEGKTIVSSEVGKAASILRQGKLVAIPTETVYGLAGNIHNPEAISSIFQLKKRPFFNPLIVHLSGIDQLESVVTEVPEKALLLAQAFWPGPLTLILPKKDVVSDLVTAGKETVAVRVPGHEMTRELLELLEFPLAAPSANPFSQISPTKAEHVREYFEGRLPMILDGGECDRGIESTIIGYKDGQPLLYRLGSIAKEEIETVVGKVIVVNKSNSSPDAPGMLQKHYSPKTPFYLVDDVNSFLQNDKSKKAGVITLNDLVHSPNLIKLVQLSSSGDLKEAAANLYKTLHLMDKLELDLIVAQRMPEKGLGVSINDRLERASSQ